MESQSDSTQTVSSLKLPMLKIGDYDLWSIRMEQYLTHTDYALWEVIVNGDAPAVASASTEGPIPPKTAEQKITRKNELKAKSTLLVAIPDEHLLKFYGIKDAKSLWEAIKTRFGGNKESKKIQKTILKQQYENFTASRSIGLDKIYDSLPSAWNNIALIMRNKPDLEELRMDDLYNNLKVTNEAVNTPLDVSTASTQGQASSSTYADDVMFSFFVNQSKSPLLDNEDMEQIDSDDLEEMDLKWQVVMLTMRIQRFIKKTRRNLNLNGKEAVGLDMKKVECYNCHRKGHFARDCRAPRNQGNRNGDNARRAKEGPTNFALMAHLSSGSSSSSSSDFELEEALKEKDDLKLKLENFEESSKNLTKLINSQISIKDKTRLGFDSHVNESEVLDNVVDSHECNQVNGRFKKCEGYHAVPPPFTRNFKPARADLSFAGLDDSVYKSKVSETITSVPNVETTVTKTSKDSLEKPKTVSSSRAVAPASAARPINTAAPKPFVNVARPRPNAFHKSHSPSRTPFNQQTALKNRNLNDKVNSGKVNSVNTTKGNKVISVVGEYGINAIIKILMVDLLHLEEVLKEKNSVLFTETECLVLSPDFKLLDESQVLLKIPRQNNMYSFDLKNVVPLGDLTYLFAKATIDESNLWHRRLGHINFKTMNKLVRGNLVRGLPSKLFENDHTCVACQKGKQHKASCKTKTVSSICKPLQLLHMDLFGPVSVRSINRKSYCLVVTDDFSRFSWVFFLATKDETPEILKNFITGIENQSDHKVKTIRSDNGTEFKNRIMNEFCEMKGIRREFSVARTPQQNGVAERKNRTLIEAARTMLADSKLPTTFWAEAVNTACYVQNRVLVIKPHNKTPYELFLGRKPALNFMRPFGCPVTILNTLDHLGKFDGKSDDGFFVGYSINSKAFRVFNTRTRFVEENLHINFLKNKPNVAGTGPNWMFDIDTLTMSINCQPVFAENQTNGNAVNVVSSSFTTVDPGRARDQRNEFESVFGQDKDGNSTHRMSTPVSAVESFLCKIMDTDRHQILDIIVKCTYDDEDVGAEADLNNLETTMSVSPIPTTRIHKDHPKEQIIGDKNSATQTRRMSLNNML
ncbi:putative ribonuclease H-like domain-containing protein [Tanacetum coccineum]